METKLLVSLMTIGLAASVIGVGTFAFFSDTETSEGNTMTAGSLDLWVNGGNLDGSTNSTLINLEDMKPSFTHYAPEITLRIVDNPGKLYKMITDVVCVGGEHPEPELAADAKDDDNYFTNDTWFDLHIGVNGVINDCLMGTEYKVGTLVGQWIYLGEYPALTDVSLKQSFHMDRNVGNEHQGDACTFTEVFRVEQTNAPMLDPIVVNCAPTV